MYVLIPTFVTTFETLICQASTCTAYGIHTVHFAFALLTARCSPQSVLQLSLWTSSRQRVQVSMQ